MSKFKFFTQERVKFYETDLQGIMHHTNYFRYLETARVEYMRNLELLKDSDFTGEPTVTVVEARCAYSNPLKFDEPFKIFVRVSEIKNASMTFEYNIVKTNADENVANATVKIATVDRQSFKPTKIDTVMKERIIAFEGL